MVEVFRRRVIKLLLDRKLLNEEFAEYISRPPISLKKIRYEPFKGKILFHTTYSEYFKQNVHMFDTLDFLVELTQHIPPKRLQLIRRYGLYASRTKGRWADMPYVAERAPAGWKASHPTVVPHPDGPEFEPLGDGEEISVDARKHAWVRLLAKVYKGYASQRRTARWIRSSVRSAAIKTDSREKPLFSPCGMR